MKEKKKKEVSAEKSDAPVKKKPKVHMQASGSTNGKLMIVFSHPGKEDLAAGQFCCNGPSADEVILAMSAAGISPEECYITGIVKHGIGSKSKPSAEDIEQDAEEFQKEIDYVKPELIMPLGAEAFKVVMQTNMKMGGYIGEIIESPRGKVLGNYSPWMIIAADPTKRPEFQEIFALARRAMDNNLKYDEYTYKIVSDPEENIKILQSYIDRGMFSIGYDAEWFGDKWMDDEVMYEFQYSCEKDVAVILNISPDGKTENRELLNTMKLILEHPKADRLGWNIRADDIRLKHRGFKLPDETLGFDGMKAVPFYDSRMAKGLETGIKKFTNYPPYYVALQRKLREHKLNDGELAKLKFIEKDIYYRYCAGDAVSHREACLNMRKNFPEATKEYFFDVFLPLTNYIRDMEMVGLPIDKEVLQDITMKYAAKYEELKQDLLQYLKDHYGVEEFNPNSPPQKKKLLFETMGMEPAYYTKSGKSPKSRAWYKKQKLQTQALYSPSTNGKSLSTIRFELQKRIEEDPDDAQLKKEHGAIDRLLNLSRVGVFATKFLSQKGIVFEEEEEGDMDDGEEPLKQSYWSGMSSDGRIHASFFEMLKNFRASSSPNVQNPASKVLAHIPNIFVPGHDKMTKEEQKAVEHLIPQNIRRIFYSGNPNYDFVELDVAGADLAIMAFVSGDPKFIKDIRSGGFHERKMRDYFKDESLTKKDISKYIISKSITFRCSYTSSLESAAMPIQADIYAENGLYVPLDTIKYALSTWYNYEEYMNYRERCLSEVEQNNCITNARGMVLKYEETDNFGIKAGWLNEALAFPIASELALYMWKASVELRKILIKEGLWMKYIYPVNTVHDAGYWISHKDLRKDNYLPELLKHVFCKKVKLATGDNVGCEVVFSDRWKGKEKFFEAETKWDFENGLWVWKS